MGTGASGADPVDRRTEPTPATWAVPPATAGSEGGRVGDRGRTQDRVPAQPRRAALRPRITGAGRSPPPRPAASVSNALRY